MSPRFGVVASVIVLVGGLAGPRPVAAHAIGGTFDLPVPLWLYLAGAAVAVAASFAVTATRSQALRSGAASPPMLRIPDPLAGAVRTVLRLIGVAWWYGAIAVGLVVGDISPLPAVLLWVGIWVGLPIVSMLLGNPWPSLSPFRTTFAALDWVARRLGARRLDLGLRYPPALARWPAVALLGTGIWAELILPGSSVAATVALLMTSYTLLTIAGMIVFGPIAWLRHAELFEVELGWFGRIGPLTRRSHSPQLCSGGEEACDPVRCIDCPECSSAAEDGERRPALRPWLAGLAEIGRPGWSDMAFIVLVLAGVSYDGLRETVIGAAGFNAVYPVVASLLGAANPTTFLLVDTLALATVIGLFLAAFLAVVGATHLLSTSGVPLRVRAGQYAVTLLPIAGGYLLAHYLTLVIQAAVWLPSLIVDPLSSLAPQVDAIPIGLISYVSVAAIVGGHVAGIVLAHRRAIRDAPARATVAGLPMVLLMISYTVLSLWIIAAPIVVEPGTLPPAGSLP